MFSVCLNISYIFAAIPKIFNAIRWNQVFQFLWIWFIWRNWIIKQNSSISCFTNTNQLLLRFYFLNNLDPSLYHRMRPCFFHRARREKYFRILLVYPFQTGIEFVTKGMRTLHKQTVENRFPTNISGTYLGDSVTFKYSPSVLLLYYGHAILIFCYNPQTHIFSHKDCRIIKVCIHSPKGTRRILKITLIGNVFESCFCY